MRANKIEKKKERCAMIFLSGVLMEINEFRQRKTIGGKRNIVMKNLSAKGWFSSRK
jgi:hypothetical protein